ncbi:MAG: sodium:solute symporter family protein [Rickettsiales bacterium]
MANFSIDIFIVIAYFFLLFIVGILNNSDRFSFKYTKKNITEYTGIILIGTIFTSSVGGGTTIGLMQNIFNYDLSYVYGILFAVPFDIIIGLILLPKITQYFGKISVGDILYAHYGKYGSIVSGFCAIIISVGYIAAQISVSSYIFEYLLGINKFYGIILSYTIIITYASFGGLKAILYTNLMQFFGIIIGVPLIGIILFKTNDLNIIQYNEKYNIIEHSNLFWGSIYIMINFSFALLTPNFIQRGLLMESPKLLQKALITKSIIYAIFIIIIAFNGLLLYAKYHSLNLTGYSIEEFNLLFENFFIGAKGIIAVGLLASATSTADSDLNIISISLYNDIYKKLTDAKHEYERILFKIITALIGFCSILIALAYKNIIEIIMFGASFWGPIIFVPLCGVFYNIKINKKQFLFLSCITLIFCILWDIFSKSQIKAMFIGILFNFIIFNIFLWINKIKKY